MATCWRAVAPCVSVFMSIRMEDKPPRRLGRGGWGGGRERECKLQMFKWDWLFAGGQRQRAARELASMHTSSDTDADACFWLVGMRNILARQRVH
eukprot:scaffold17703_cov119-Isochrysis_galbana.AAC.2